MTRAILDTSVLIAGRAPEGVEAAISAASIAELHFGVLVADDDDKRARRLQRRTAIESSFEPIPLDVRVAREWGRLAAAIVERGGQPRRRALDLVIAATANVHDATLVTTDLADFSLIDDLVQVEALT